MLNKILKIVCASLMFATCGAIQIPQEQVDYAEQLRCRLSDVKPNITTAQCQEIVQKIPALCSYNLWKEVDVQCGSRGLICLDIKTVDSVKKFKIFVGSVIKVTQLTSHAIKPTRDRTEVPVEKNSNTSLRSRKKEQAIASSLKRCPLQETPPLSDDYLFLSGSGEDDDGVSFEGNDSSSGE